MDHACETTDQRRQQPFHHLGICVDRSPLSDRVVPHAVALAKVFDAELTVLNAVEPSHERPETTPTDPLEWEMLRTAARKHIAALQSEHGTAEMPLGIEVLEGHPAEEIRDWVNCHDVDLTVLSSHGASGRTEWSLAGTARKLIEGIFGSVFLVPASSVQESIAREVTYERIIVPLDGSPRAECALPAAVSVARAHGSELLLLHVVPKPESSCPCPLSEEDSQLEQRLVERNTRAAETYLEGVRKHLAIDSVRVRTLVAVDGDVRDEILRRIVEDHIDLVVISGHGSGGRAEFPFGSVASFLLEHTTAPLLVIRESCQQLARTQPPKYSRVGIRLPDLAAS